MISHFYLGATGTLHRNAVNDGHLKATIMDFKDEVDTKWLSIFATHKL